MSTAINRELQDAQQQVLGTSELLCSILSYLPQPDLICFQRVSRIWRVLISTAPQLQQAIFSADTPLPTTASERDLLNQFVINRLRWCPALDLDQINTTDFACVNLDPKLRAMAYEDASWRAELLTWPPVSSLLVTRGSISQEEYYLQDLHLVNQLDIESARTASPESDEDEAQDSQPPPLVLHIEDFPYNLGNTCRGIKVIDVLYGLRIHYLQNQSTLEVYDEVNFDSPVSGKIIAGFIKDEPTLSLDVTFLTM
jgi:hypothetical protein